MECSGDTGATSGAFKIVPYDDDDNYFPNASLTAKGGNSLISYGLYLPELHDSKQHDVKGKLTAESGADSDYGYDK